MRFREWLRQIRTTPAQEPRWTIRNTWQRQRMRWHLLKASRKRYQAERHLRKSVKIMATLCSDTEMLNTTQKSSVPSAVDSKSLLTCTEHCPAPEITGTSPSHEAKPHVPVTTYDDARMQEAYYLATHNMDPRDFYQ
jgi:hypothetical protein